MDHHEGFQFNWTSIAPICGGSIFNDHGSISSPGYPGKYPPNRDCKWHIFSQSGKRIKFHFLSLMLEEHPTCENDYVEVQIKTIKIFICSH